MSQSFLPVPTGSLVVPVLTPPPRPGKGGWQPPTQPWLSLIIPTYNERDNVLGLIQQLSRSLDQELPGDYELIVVDDNSPDDTWKLLQDVLPVYPQLRVMHRQQERGLATAVVRGWQAAQGQILGVIDGDRQHPPEVLVQLLTAVEAGADLAVASRNTDGGGVSTWSLSRRILSRGAQLLGLLLLPGVISRVSDPMSGYFLIRRAAIAGYGLSPCGYKILIEVLGRGQIGRIAEVGYVFQERQQGESKVTWRQSLDYLQHLLRLRLSLGHLDRFWRFGLVGLSGVFVDMTVLYLLSDPTALGWGLTRSKVVAAELAILNNFFWNDRWTFQDISRQQQSWPQQFKRLIKFNLICALGLFLNVILLNLLFNLAGLNRYLANLIAIALVTLWNFWVNLKLSWRVTAVK